MSEYAHTGGVASTAPGGRLPSTGLPSCRDGGESPGAGIIVADEWGNVRRLTPSAECDCWQGTHDLGHGPEPYWLPARVVEAWLAAAAADALPPAAPSRSLAQEHCCAP